MKKILTTIIIFTIILSMSACSKENTDTNKDNNQETQSTITNNDNKNEEIVFGETLEDKGVLLFDAEMKQFTKDTLPESSQKEDFDGDGLKNKEEIEANTDMYKVDTDSDGLSDYDEIKTTKTDPNKWSSRDDDHSDLTFWIKNNPNFKEGYTASDANDIKVYLTNPEDQLYIISKVSTDVFNNLETMSEAFQIKYFSGKLALNCSKYIEEVANSIAVYKNVNGIATKVESTVTKDKLVEFNLDENDIFVFVYQIPEVENELQN